LLGLIVGVPGTYLSYASWHEAHRPSPVSTTHFPPISVVPDIQAFASDFVHDNYIFTISNETGIDQYQAQITFKMVESSLTFHDFSMEIPIASRKPIIDGSRILDMSAVGGSDASGHLLPMSNHVKPY